MSRKRKNSKFKTERTIFIFGPENGQIENDREVRMKKRSFLIPIFVLSICFFFFHDAAAQAGRGKARIHGVVLDEAGIPIKNAKILLEFITYKRDSVETKTDEKGKWSIIGLGTGRGRVIASADGFIPASTEINIQQLALNPLIKMNLERQEHVDRPILEDELSLEAFEKGNLLFTEKKYDEAILIYEQFLEKNPSAYQIHLNIGDCYREKGELEKAIEEYHKVLEQAQKDESSGKEMTAKALANIGECHLKTGDYEKARDFFKQSIESFQENEILAYNVGEIYFSNQKVEEAIHYFELATQIKSDWGQPYLKLGYAYLNKGENNKAKKNFKRFLEIIPESPQAQSVQSIIEYLEKIKKSY